MRRILKLKDCERVGRKVYSIYRYVDIENGWHSRALAVTRTSVYLVVVLATSYAQEIPPTVYK